MINTYEELSANAWPALHTKLYDGWVLRFAQGYTRRANAVVPLYESTLPLDEKIDFCEKIYASHQLPCVFKLTEASTPRGIDGRLEARGYAKSGDSAVRVLDLHSYNHREAKEVKVESQFSREWLEGYLHCSDITDDKTRSIAGILLDRITGPVICVSKWMDNRVAGCGFGSVEGDAMGIFSVAVDKNYRGKGFGRDIMQGILGAALEQKIKTAFLQVSVGNTPAEKLYDSLGFKEAYRYWYRSQDTDLK